MRDVPKKKIMIQPLLLALLILAQKVHSAPSNAKCESSKCSWKLWSHYEEMGCEAIYDVNGSCCPTAFKCPLQTDQAGCRYRGRTYPIGSSIVHSDPCRECHCAPNPATGQAHVQCVNVECRENLQGVPSNCRLLYEENKCCSSRKYCPKLGSESPDPTTGAICRNGNRTYVEGERMDFVDDQCLACLCNEGYTGRNGPGCKRIDTCYLGQRQNLDDGCMPVYNVDTCCPIQWICPEDEPFNPTNVSTSIQGPRCTFAGQSYPLGSSWTKQNSCMTCTCATPPQFTCVQQTTCN